MVSPSLDLTAGTRIVSPLTRRRLLGVGVGAGLGLLAGCSATSADGAGAAASASTRTVDTAHGSVVVPATPKRIVAVAYDTPFQLMSMGVTPVGVFDYSQWYEQYPADQVAFLKPITTIGKWGEPDLEKVAALTPDLIVGVVDEVKDDVYTQLSQVAPTTLFASPSRGDWEDPLAKIAGVTGVTAVIAGGKKEFDDLVTRLSTDYRAALTQQKWVSYSFGDSDGQFSVQFPSGATGALMKRLGTTFGSVIASADPESGYESYSVEKADLLADVTVALHPLDAAGREYASLAEVQKSGVWSQQPFRETDRDFGLVLFHGVNTYPSGVAALEELEEKVLKQL